MNDIPILGAPEPGPDAASAAQRAELAPRMHVPHPLWCGPCIVEARTAELVRQQPPPIHPAVTIMNGTAICDVEGRHRILVQTPGSSIVVAQPGLIPPGMLN